MAGQYSQPPVRNVAGATSDAPWQPLADCGYGNPFFYHAFADDFDTQLGAAGLYTKTATGNGTVAHTAGDGGLALFTTNSSTPAGTDICSLQLPAASVSLTQGKKLFYVTRLQLANATNPAFVLGLIQTTTTPFTVTDGIWFSKASGSTNIFLNHAVASTVTQVQVPAGALTPANATNFDLGFYLMRNGDIVAFAGSQLVGLMFQNGTTPPYAGPQARITPASLTTANLNLTMAVQSGTAASTTMTADFHGVFKER